MPANLSLILCIVAVLTGCTASVPVGPATDFAAPGSNQLKEIHHESDHGGHAHAHIQPAEATSAIEVVLVPSELVVGPNRFAVGLFDGEGRMVQDAAVHFHYFDLSNPQTPKLEIEADAAAVHTPDGFTTIFTHEREFNRAGDWGVEVQAHFPDDTAAIKRIAFQVLPQSPTLKPGQHTPVLDTPTASSVNGNLSRLSSAQLPNPAFYQLSLAQAVTSGKPTLLLFATPAFCQTRFCGPAYQLVDQLQSSYGSTVNFIHVEVYTGLPNPAANNWAMAPSMAAFGLTTEPWLYLIDNQGIVTYRVEGMFTTAEIERHMQSMLGL